MAGIQINNGLEINAPRAADMRSGKLVANKTVPFASVAEALSAIDVAYRFEGLEFTVNDGTLKKYRFTADYATDGVEEIGGASSPSWGLNGNEASESEFIGTTNEISFVIKANNQVIAYFKPNGDFVLGDPNDYDILTIKKNGDFIFDGYGDIKLNGNNNVINGTLKLDLYDDLSNDSMALYTDSLGVVYRDAKAIKSVEASNTEEPGYDPSDGKLTLQKKVFEAGLEVPEGATEIGGTTEKAVSFVVNNWFSINSESVFIGYASNPNYPKFIKIDGSTQSMYFEIANYPIRGGKSYINMTPEMVEIGNDVIGALGGVGIRLITATDIDMQAAEIIMTLPTYADNAAATSAGLKLNQLYKTATGEVRTRV